jgi:hypothetical protein
MKRRQAVMRFPAHSATGWMQCDEHASGENKKPIHAMFKEPMESHGRDRDDGFRNPPGTEVRRHRSEAEARRTPPRVRSLMEIVGSDEQMASMGFAFDGLKADGCESWQLERTAFRR